MTLLESKTEHDSVVIQVLLKRIDAETSTSFKSEVNDLIKSNDNSFIINLSNVDFIDSSGLGVLISILKTLEHGQRHLILCSIKDTVLNLFNVTRMNRVFKIFANRDEAFNYLETLEKK